MSKRSFKTLLNRQKNIVFDYGQLQQLPQLQNDDANFQLTCICKKNGFYFIKHKNSSQWKKLQCKEIISGIVYNVDDSSEPSVYKWGGQWSEDDQLTVSENNNFLLWNHNEIADKYQFFVVNDTAIQKIQLPYYQLAKNKVLIDFTGFTSTMLQGKLISFNIYAY